MTVPAPAGGDSASAAGTGSGFDRMWADLTPVGRDGSSGGYRRFAWTDEDAGLRDWFAGEATARGLDLVEDRAGNQWAWLGDPDADGPGVVLGSHLDSVPDGGAFDGPLGVVSAFAALDALRVRGIVPSRPLAVAHFGDEEGARFGIACAGSRIITGALDADRARGLTDADGIQLGDAFARTGRRADHLGRDDETLARIGTFVELHVEQGRGLVDLDRAVAVGTGIRPHGRWRVDLTGTADHAGTTRMFDRKDAMQALALLVTSVRTAAITHEGVATCGKVLVTPNGVNAIASHVTAWLDARAGTEQQVLDIVAEITRDLDAVDGTITEESWTGFTHFDPELGDDLAGLLDGAPQLDTGAGHDAGVLAAAGIPTAMLFVRNPTGVSHSPAEFAERDDCLAGIDALTRVVEHLVR